MFKILTAILVVTVAMFAGAAQQLESGIVTGVNVNNNAKLDTVASGDTMVIVIDQIVNGVLADKMVLNLPDILASGDSCQVFVQELPSNDAGKNYETRNWANRSRVSDNTKPPRTDSLYTGKTYTLGNFYQGDGPATFVWDPADSVTTPRARILILQTAGTPVLTGSDSLGTSSLRMQQLYTPKP